MNQERPPPASSGTWSTTRPRPCCAAPRRRAPPLGAGQPAGTRVRQGQPGHDPGARPVGQHEGPDAAEPLVRAERQPVPQGHGHHQPGAELLQRHRWRARRHLLVHRLGRHQVAQRHAHDRPARPGAGTTTPARPRLPRVLPSLRRLARQRPDHRALHLVPDQPGRDPGQRLGDLRQLHDPERAGPRQPAEDRRPADQAPADLPVAGLGHAGQAGAAPGPDRGHRRPGGGDPLPAHLLPPARRGRRRRPGHLRRLLLRADQAHPDHADAAGHRGPDPHHRRSGGREHRDLRTRQGGDTRRQIDRVRHRHGLQEGPLGDHRRERRHGDDRVHPLHPRHRGGEGLRLHAGHRHDRLAVHRRAGDAGDPRHARAHADLAARPRSAPASSATSGASTSWARRAGSSRCRA